MSILPDHCDTSRFSNMSSKMGNKIIELDGINSNLMTSRSLLPCLTNGCYRRTQKCDGKKDCLDGIDEANCDDPKQFDEKLLHFLVYRKNRNNYFYEPGGSHSYDDEFSWQDTYTGYSEDNYVPIMVPKRPARWIITAIGISQDYGFSIMRSPTLVINCVIFFKQFTNFANDFSFHLFYHFLSPLRLQIL